MRDYNFFEGFDKPKRIKIDPKSSNFIALVAVLLFAITCGALVYANALLSAQVNALRREAQESKANAVYSEAVELKRRVDAMEQYDAMAGGILSTFEETDTLGAETVEALTAALPASVTLSSAVIDHANASLEFAAPDRKTAAELLLNLKNSGLFESVDLSAVITDPDTGFVSVIINAVMKAGEAK